MGLEDLLPSSVTWLWFGDLSSVLHGLFHSAAHSKASGFHRARDQTREQTKTESMFFNNLILEVT